MVIKLKNTVMNTQEIGSQFIGTPWNNDQEIYNFASERHDIMGLDWDKVRVELISKGLNDSYADAIIANLMNVENEDKGTNNKRKYISWVLSALFAVVAYFILRPVAYGISPEYGRYILIGLIATGLTLIKNYREGKDS